MTEPVVEPVPVDTVSARVRAHRWTPETYHRLSRKSPLTPAFSNTISKGPKLSEDTEKREEVARQMDDVAARQRDLPPGERYSISTTYGLIALMSAIFALTAWLFPRYLAQGLFGDAVFTSDGVPTMKESLQNVMDAARHGSHPPQYPSGQSTMHLDPLYTALIRILGTAFLASSVASYALRGAALANKMHLNTYKRLEVGLLLWALTSLALYPAIWRLMYKPSAGLMIMLPLMVLGTAGPHLLQTQNALQVVGHTLADLSKPRTLRATLYAVLVPVFALAGVSYILAPSGTLTQVFGRDGGAVGQLLWQLIGSGLHLVPFVSLNLKKAADDHRLGANTHILSNLGLGGASLGHVLALVGAWRAGLRGPALPGLAIIWLLTLALSLGSIPAEPANVPAAAAEATAHPAQT